MDETLQVLYNYVHVGFWQWVTDLSVTFSISSHWYTCKITTLDQKLVVCHNVLLVCLSIWWRPLITRGEVQPKIISF